MKTALAFSLFPLPLPFHFPFCFCFARQCYHVISWEGLLLLLLLLSMYVCMYVCTPRALLA